MHLHIETEMDMEMEIEMEMSMSMFMSMHVHMNTHTHTYTCITTTTAPPATPLPLIAQVCQRAYHYLVDSECVDCALRMQHSSMNGPIVLVVIVVVLLVTWVCWRAASEQTKYRVHAWFKYVDRARRGRLGAAAKIVTSVRTPCSNQGLHHRPACTMQRLRASSR